MIIVKTPSLSDLINKTGKAPSASTAAKVTVLHLHSAEVQERANRYNTAMAAALLMEDEVAAAPAKKKAAKKAAAPAPETTEAV